MRMTSTRRWVLAGLIGLWLTATTVRAFSPYLWYGLTVGTHVLSIHETSVVTWNDAWSIVRFVTLKGGTYAVLYSRSNHWFTTVTFDSNGYPVFSGSLWETNAPDGGAWDVVEPLVSPDGERLRVFFYARGKVMSITIDDPYPAGYHP